MKITGNELKKILKEELESLDGVIGGVFGEDAELTGDPGAERPRNLVDEAGEKLEKIASLVGLAFEPDVAAFIQELSIRLEGFPEVKAQLMTE
jgi:hypothetical protein